jgi:hypothetical protein
LALIPFLQRSSQPFELIPLGAGNWNNPRCIQPGDGELLRISEKSLEGSTL